MRLSEIWDRLPLRLFHRHQRGSNVAQVRHTSANSPLSGYKGPSRSNDKVDLLHEFVPDKKTEESLSKDITPSGLGYSILLHSLAGFSVAWSGVGS